jgi:hypothetical protein
MNDYFSSVKVVQEPRRRLGIIQSLRVNDDCNFLADFFFVLLISVVWLCF